MKIQPIDIDSPAPRELVTFRAEPAKPLLKSRLKRLFDRQFPNVLKVSAAEKPSIGEAQYSKDGGGGGGGEFEPSSVCLDKLVRNYMEESQNDKQQQSSKYGRNRCNCFNGNGNESSDDEFDLFSESVNGGLAGNKVDALKSLIPCASAVERNLLTETAMIVEKNKRKADLRKIVSDGLSSLGYDSSICGSKWDKTPSFPAGEYEYIDVLIEGERFLIDIDFKSEFEMAKSTSTYNEIVQSLPCIFVGKPERLDQIVSIVSEAAKHSLKKKGMHFPPWRKGEFMRAKWLSPFTRASETETEEPKEENPPPFKLSGESEPPSSATLAVISSPWQPPAVKPKRVEKGAERVTGLASLLKEKP